LKHRTWLEQTFHLKRVVSSILVFCMMFSFNVSASAQSDPDPAVIEVGSVLGSRGETVSVPVYLDSGSNEVAAYDIDVKYDPDVLSFDVLLPDAVTDQTSTEEGAEFENFEYEAKQSEGIVDDIVNVSFFTAGMPTTLKQKVFTIKFKIKSGAVSGDSKVTVKSYQVMDSNDLLTFGTIAGKVTVNNTPTASAVSITGMAKAGDTLTGNYTYADAEDDEEGETTFQWYAANDASGTNKAAIAEATNKTFKPTSAQQDKYITFEVTPLALTGATTGTAVSSSAVGPVTVDTGTVPITNTVAVAIGSASGAAGQTVDVPVSVTAASTSIGSYGMQIDFDKNALEVASINQKSGGELFVSNFSNADGWLRVGWTDASSGDHPIVAGQKLFTVTFKMKDKATPGDKALAVATEDVTHFSFTDLAVMEMDKTLSAGKVTVTPYVPSSNAEAPANNTPGGSSSGVSGSKPSNSSGFRVIVNGKEQGQIATGATTKEDGKTVLTVTVDTAQLAAQLAKEGDKPVIVIPVTTSGVDKVSAVLTGDAVKAMENKQAILEVLTPNGNYKLPAAQIVIDRLAAQLGGQVNLSEIVVHVDIARSDAATVELAESTAEKGKFSIVVPPVEFTVTALYNGKKVEVDKFSSYVEREIPLPDGVDPNKITTGIVVEPDGTVRHVPTKVVVIDGTYYARINRLTNSTYSVIWHPLEFLDVENHWAKDAINDMGSRMIIDGTGDGRFGPDQDITRAEFVALLVRGLGLKPENGATAFSDVKTSDWYSSAVNTAYAYQMISGFVDGTFRPNDKITREQAMMILSKAMTITGLKAKLSAQSENATLRSFRDAADVSGWAQSSVADSVQAGLVSGRSASKLAPKASITRAEIATIIQRLLQKSGLI